MPGILRVRRSISTDARPSGLMAPVAGQPARRHSIPAMSALKPCYLSQVLLEEEADHQAIFIQEREGTRRIKILIGPLEALAIDRAIKKANFPRPLTHDLFVRLLESI